MSFDTDKAYANTEKEVLSFAFDMEPEEMPGYHHHDDDDDNDLIVDELSQVEGWDGRPLGDDEIAEVNINGFPESGNDRPRQLAESEAYEREIANRDNVIGIMQRQQGELAARGDPMRQQREEQWRNDVEDRIVANPAEARQLLQHMQSTIAEREERSVNVSLGAAHREHGEDFERAYTALTSQNVNDPVAVATVQQIWNAPDPGAALMQWYDRRSGGGRLPPSLNTASRDGGGRRSAAGPGRSRAARTSDDWPVDDDNDIGGFDPRAEAAIWGDAFR